MKKICSRCNIEKPIIEFGKDKNKKDGYKNICRECRHDAECPNAKRIARRFCKDGYKYCPKCKLEKATSEFSKNKSKSSGFDTYCKDCKHEYRYPNKKRITKHICKNGFKFCPKCGNEKPVDKFNKDITSVDGLHGCCKECERKRYLNNQQKSIERVTIYFKTPRGKAAKSRMHHKRKMRNEQLLITLTDKQWDKIIKEQHNLCNWCGEPFTENNPPTRDEIIPVSSIACPGFTYGNTQALHLKCNISKGNRFSYGKAIYELLI